MPYTLKIEETPNALRITRLTTSGRITEPEADELMKELAPGGPYSGLPMLAVTGENTEVTADARRVFTTRVGVDGAVPSAIVTTSAIMRVTVNFIGRVNGNHTTRLFANEREAIQWLEQTCLPKRSP
jgi:hypothetical protein